MRRTTVAVVLTAAALALTPLGVRPAHAAPSEGDLTVLATTDVHGHVYNWDYFTDGPYRDGGKPWSSAPLGMTRVATIVKDVRAQRGADSVVTLDNGDAIQGTPP